MEFKKVNGVQIDLERYVLEYQKTHPGVEVMVGCDSQNRRYRTSYAVVVALYNPGKGAHVVFRRWTTDKEKVKDIRLLNEAWNSIETAEALKTAGISVKYIDLDLNPNPKFGSHSAFKQAVGMVEGMGYEVRFKTLGPLVTTMADAIARK